MLETKGAEELGKFKQPIKDKKIGHLKEKIVTQEEQPRVSDEPQPGPDVQAKALAGPSVELQPTPSTSTIASVVPTPKRMRDEEPPNVEAKKPCKVQSEVKVVESRVIFSLP